MISIIVPVYNEEKSIKKVLQALFSVPIKEKEVIVVNDGSIDGTLRELEDLKKDYSFKLVNLVENRGKGYAMRKGFEVCSGNYIVFQDADLEYPVTNIEKMYKKIVGTGADMVVGVRSLDWNTVSSISFGSFFANKVISRLIDFPDTFSGHRIVKKDVYSLLNLQSNGFEIETELTLKVLSGNFYVETISVDYFPRNRSSGKKIGFSDFLKILKTYYSFKFYLKHSKNNVNVRNKKVSYAVEEN